MVLLEMGSTAWNIEGTIPKTSEPVIPARCTIPSLDLSRANICSVRRKGMRTYNPNSQSALRTGQLPLTVYDYVVVVAESGTALYHTRRSGARGAWKVPTYGISWQLGR